MSARAQVTIVMVSFNTRELTLKCLASVFANTHDVDVQVRVIDNDSRDGSAEAIAEHFPQVQVTQAGQNLGFGVACNRAAEQLFGDYVLLLNPDTEFLGNSLGELVAFAQARPANGFWGGRMFYPDGSPNPFSCFGRMTLWNQVCRVTGLASVLKGSAVFNTEEYGGWARDSVREVDNVTGGFLLIDRQAWEQLGGFDERFFMYGEEADLQNRARAAGWQPIVTPTARIMHVSGASETVRADKMVRLLKAKSELVRMYWPAWQQPVGRGLLWGWAASRAVAVWLMVQAGRQKAGHNAWPEIYQRRSEWLFGYSESTKSPIRQK